MAALSADYKTLIKSKQTSRWYWIPPVSSVSSIIKNYRNSSSRPYLITDTVHIFKINPSTKWTRVAIFRIPNYNSNPFRRCQVEKGFIGSILIQKNRLLGATKICREYQLHFWSFCF